MAMPTTLLLPPSEGKATGGRGRWRPGGGSFRRLGPDRAVIADALAEAMVDDAEAAKLLGVKGAALDDARRVNRQLEGAPTLPAAERYQGVVWEHLGPASLSRSGFDQASESVVILSALLGAVRFADPVPNYKLKMGASLPAVGTLTARWRDPVTEAVRGRAKQGLVIDLLPQNHGRAIDLDRLGAREVVRVEFRSAAGRAIGHDAKAVKGTFARHLLEADAPLAAAEEFSWGPWTASVERIAPGQVVVTVVAE